MNSALSEKVHRVTMLMELVVLAFPISLLLLSGLLFVGAEILPLTARGAVGLTSLVLAAGFLIPFWNLSLTFVLLGAGRLESFSDRRFRFVLLAVIWVLLSVSVLYLVPALGVPWNPVFLDLVSTGAFGLPVAIPAVHLLCVRKLHQRANKSPFCNEHQR